MFTGIPIIVSSSIVSKGNNKRKLQQIALNIFEITSAFNIKLPAFWILQKYNGQADALSNNKDNDNWITFDRYYRKKIGKTNNR